MKRAKAKISNKKGLDINDLNSAKSQSAILKFLRKNRTPVIIVSILVLNYFASSIVTWYLFFTR